MRLNFQNLVFLFAKNQYFLTNCIQNVIDGVQIQVCNIINEIVNIFGQHSNS